MARRAGSVHLDLPVDVQAGLLVDRSVGVDGPRMAGVAVGPLRVRRGWRRSVARGAPRPAGVGQHERQGIGALEPTAVTPCIATCRGGAIPRRLESARPRQGSELERGLAAAVMARGPRWHRMAIGARQRGPHRARPEMGVVRARAPSGRIVHPPRGDEGYRRRRTRVAVGADVVRGGSGLDGSRLRGGLSTTVREQEDCKNFANAPDPFSRNGVHWKHASSNFSARLVFQSTRGRTARRKSCAPSTRTRPSRNGCANWTQTQGRRAEVADGERSSSSRYGFHTAASVSVWCPMVFSLSGTSTDFAFGIFATDFSITPMSGGLISSSAKFTARSGALIFARSGSGS